jgi:hypothetical protein
MHKDFYASGFLYHFPTQQILLQQIQALDTSTSIPWVLFGDTNRANETEAARTFQRVINDELNHELELEDILPVYQFFDKERSLPHFVFYAQVADDALESVSGRALQWFNFKKLHRTTMSKQTRQNIIVAQRVIDLAQRIAEETPYNVNQ